MIIFVFGSNLAGRHGKGAALEARKKWGAIYGQGEGLQGRSWAIPTKDSNLKPLPLTNIRRYVENFLTFAAENPDYTFKLTAIGTGLAGYDASQIGPMFSNATPNVRMPEEFKPWAR